MTGRKLNLVKFKKAAIDFSTKYLTCFKCYSLIDHTKFLTCSHRFCAKCRPSGSPCLICKAEEGECLQPLGELLQVFENLQLSLGIDSKIRQKCFEKIFPNRVDNENQDENVLIQKTNIGNPSNNIATVTILPSGSKDKIVVESKATNKEDKINNIVNKDKNELSEDAKGCVQSEVTDDVKTTASKSRRTIKRKNDQEVPVDNNADSGIKSDSEKSVKRKRQISPSETVPAQQTDSEMEVIEDDVLKKKTKSIRKTRNKEETEPEISESIPLPTKTPGRKKKIEEVNDNEESEVFKKPIKSALKSKRFKEETPTSVKKISFAKKEKEIKNASGSTCSESEESAISKDNEMVVLSSNISEDQLKQLKKFEKKFRCRIVTDYDDSVTHFVTSVDEKNLGCRTLKYLLSLLGHKFLLGFSWISESLKTGTLRSEEDYEVLGTTKQAESTLGAPKISRTTKPKIFQDHFFYLDGKFSTAGYPSKDNFKKLIELGGGTIVNTQQQLKTAIKENLKNLRFIIDPQNPNSKFLDHPNHIQATDLLNKMMELRFD